MTILDWLKEAPLSAVYKERLAQSIQQIVSLEQTILSLEKESVELKARLEECEKHGRTLEKQIIEKETHDNSVTFDEKTGTWINNKSKLRYCPSCKAKNIMEPMQKLEQGWKCHSQGCNSFYKNTGHKDSGIRTSKRPGSINFSGY